MGQWKAVESGIGRLTGMDRIPVSGRARGDAPDIESSWCMGEVKHRKKLPEWLHDAWRQVLACQKGNRTGKLPVVILHEKGMRYRDAYVLMRVEDFAEWFGDDLVE